MTQIPQLKAGGHAPQEKEYCFMEAVALLAGEPHSHYPQCACWILSNIGVSMNDYMGLGPTGDALRQEFLAPLVPLLIGTRGSIEIERARGILFLQKSETYLGTLLELEDLTPHETTMVGRAVNNIPVALTDLEKKLQDIQDAGMHKPKAPIIHTRKNLGHASLLVMDAFSALAENSIGKDAWAAVVGIYKEALALE